MINRRNRSAARAALAAAVPCAALTLNLASPNIASATATWMGGAGSWGDASKWLGNPSPPDGLTENTVYIGAGGAVNLGGGSFSANGIRMGIEDNGNGLAGTGQLTVDSGTLYDADDTYVGIGNAGTFNLTGGRFIMETTEHFFLGGGPTATGTASGAATVNITGGVLQFDSKYGFEPYPTTPGPSTINMSGGRVYFNWNYRYTGGLVTGAPASITANTFNFTGGELEGIRQFTTITGLSGSGSISFDDNTAAACTLSLATNTTWDGRFLGYSEVDLNGTQRQGRGLVIKEGAGELTVTGATGQWSNTSGLTINGGSVKLTADNVLGTTCGSVTLADTAGVALNLNGRAQQVRTVVGGGANGGNVLLGAGGALTLAFPDGGVPLTYNGVISGTGGSVTKQGSGVWELGGLNTYTGTTTVTTGTVRVLATGGLGGGDIVDNATVEVLSTTSAGNITGSGVLTVGNGGANVFTAKHVRMSASSAVSVTAGATLRIAPNGGDSGVSRIAAMTIAGKLDLNDNDLIASTPTDTAAVVSLVVSGRNGGAWDGNGITSTAAKSHAQQATTLGVLSGTEYNGVNGAPVGGMSVSSTDTVVRYTWYGDADFNGEVNFDDYIFTDGGFNNGLAGWLNGDFDFSGGVDFDDYIFIDLGFNSQNGTLRRAQAFLSGDDRSRVGMDDPALRMVEDHFAQFGTDYAIGFLSAVPEPSTLVAGAVALATTFRRRRRR